MNILELSVLLLEISAKHGDLPIVGGQLHDIVGLNGVVLLDADGMDAEMQNTTPVEVLLV